MCPDVATPCVKDTIEDCVTLGFGEAGNEEQWDSRSSDSHDKLFLRKTKNKSGVMKRTFLVLYSKQPILGLTQEWFRELSFSMKRLNVLSSILQTAHSRTNTGMV